MTQDDEISATADPFRDPHSGAVSQYGDANINLDEQTTLIVGRDASLTLGTDSLVVLDEALTQQRISSWRNCCGLLPTQTRPSPTRSIPFHNILHATLSDFDLSIHHAHPISSSVVRPACISYPLDKSDRTAAIRFVSALLRRAYGASQRHKRIKILVNPFGGKGSAQKWYLRDIEPIFRAADCTFDVEHTRYKGHAVEIAEQLDVERYDVLASCSGDGLPHEVFNGLGRKPDAVQALHKIAVVQLPCGSGNAMSINLNGTSSPSLAALAVVKGLRTPMDLLSVTQGDKRYLSFLSQSHGIVAETDLGTEHLRWMGEARFTYGFLVRLLGKTVWPADVAVKLVCDKDEIREHYKNHTMHCSTAPGAASSASSSIDLLPRTAEERPPTESTTISKPSSSSATSTDLTSQPPPNSSGLPPLKYGTINMPLPDSWTPFTAYPTIGNFYAGNMPFMTADSNFFQAALPSDGALDLVCIDGTIRRTAAVQCLLAVANGTFFDLPHVNYRKVEAYRIVPWGCKGGPVNYSGTRASQQKAQNGKFVAANGIMGKLLKKTRSSSQKKGGEGYISIDGERVPFEPFQVEVHKGLGMVLSRSGKIYEAPPLP